MNICIFIDPSIDSFQYFIENVIQSVEIVPLNLTQDSLKQVADYLKEKQEISEVHIISHGSPGCLNLGKTQLSLDNLENYSHLLKQSFSAVDSLILYGCHLAKGKTGQNFIKKLHQITGKNIAATASLTGNNLLGGNWNFEFKLGNFNVNLPFHKTALQAYPSVLATFTVNSTGDLDDGDIGNGITTLREAINAANTNPGEDRIEFNIPVTDPGFNIEGYFTIQPASNLPEITDNSLFIDGKSQPGFLENPIIELDFRIVDAQGLAITSDNNTIQGLVLNGSRLAAINFRDSGNNLIQDNFIGTDVTGTIAARNDGFGAGILLLDSPNNIIQNNLISSNSAPGLGGPNIGISGGLANENQIIGNLIGTDITGTVALENNGTWSIIITEASNNIIGGTTEAERNVIGVSSNGFGIIMGLAPAAIVPPITDGVASGNRILGNYIGTDITGKVALGSQDSVGILLTEDLGFGIGNTINIIGGTTPEERNVISGHAGGIFILNDTRNAYRVIGNYIGTDESGTIAIGNGTDLEGAGVIIVGSNSSIGGTGLGEGNLISGNAIGIQIIGDPLDPADDISNNQIIGNLIGTQADGITPLGNTKQGILVESVNNNNNNIIGGTEAGAGNIIAFNGLNGIEITDSNGVELRQNEIFNNGNLGIDLIATANNSKAEPVLNSALIINDITTVTGTLNSTPNAEFTLEFFSNTVLDPSLNGEGERFILSTVVTTDDLGNANFNIELPAGITVNKFITATATNNIDKNTSEFSAGVEVIDPLIVTNTADSGIGSLREAINFANTIPGENTISFNIPQTDPGFNIDTNSFTIQPA